MPFVKMLMIGCQARNGQARECLFHVNLVLTIDDSTWTWKTMIFSVTATDFSAYCVRTQITEMILHTTNSVLFIMGSYSISEEILLQAEYEAPFIHGIKQSR